MFSKNLSAPPKHSELYYWADYVELLCLTDLDRQFSVEQLANYANFADDLMATSPDAQDGDKFDVLDIILDREVGLEPDGALEETPTSGDPADVLISYDDFGRAAEQTDDRRQWCEDIFRLLADRQRSLGERYPFLVDSANLRIEMPTIEETGFRYIFYLCCSSLSAVTPSRARELTSWFEIVSGDVLRALLPSSARIDHYGTARGPDRSVFKGTPYKRLTLLAKELGGEVIVREVDFHPRDSGDNGLDLVAWLPMGDNEKGVAAFFCQCACGKQWDGKQYEASHERWREFIMLTSPSTKITFVPHHFRKPGNFWYSASDVSGILIDRLRALRFDAPMGNPEGVALLVKEALTFRRGLV